MDIKGFRVPLVYCEGALDIAREIYLGFTVDRDARANILMLSARGGMDIEQVADESPEAIARLYPDPWRGPLDFELSQLVYTYPRLKSMWSHLERHAGGVGTRGPGEQQLETDRRLVQVKRLRLERELGPWDSVINAFPFAANEAELAGYARAPRRNAAPGVGGLR